MNILNVHFLPSGYPIIESINEVEEAVRNMGEPNFNDLGTPLEEIFEDGPEKFMHFNLSKPNELYNEYATERLKKDLKRMNLTDDELELLEKAKEKARFKYFTCFLYV